MVTKNAAEHDEHKVQKYLIEHFAMKCNPLGVLCVFFVNFVTY
jgi:hypothetical protein